MKEFLKQFEEYCRTPGVDSGKARSYAKAIEYLCDYLQITVVNEQTISLIKDFQNNLNDRNSFGYKNALQFFAKRGQKSYLENGFVKAALNNFFKFMNEYNNGKLKSSFLKFLGPIDSLNGYQKSYKLVLYKVMFDLMDKDGKCYSVDVSNKFRQFYVDRVNAGKVADIDVDKRIEFIRDSDIRDAYNVIITNPFKVISDKGFMYKTNESFELEQICFDDKLIAQLTHEDVSKIKEIVDKKLDLYFSKIDSLNLENDWWPSLSEYNPEITKEKWLELLSNSAVFTESALKMMADFYVFGGTATCIQLAEQYNKTYNYYLMTSVHLAERVVKTTGCPTIRDENKAQNSKWWPVLYVGRDADKQEKGSFVWKIRDELYDALTEFGIERYFEDNTNTGGEKMTTKQKIEAIKNYIAAKGFNYEGNLIENFYLSLKSKPFVILAGTSGTGKTRLVKLFAEAIGAKMKLVPVRPDWSDSSDLFGHTNLSSKFQPGAIIDFVKQAEWDKETPYFLCLDEMNLARVEYYLSDFLSIIETRDRKDNGDIETDPMVDVDYYKDKDAAAKYGRVFIPDNLYIIGTVNMDETTFPFSKKVLDRANTIEFSYVNLMSKPKESYAAPVALNEDNSFLKTEYLYLRDCDDSDVVDSVCFDLEELNSILVKANLHVGYRVRDEISFYMMNNKNADLLSKEAAFDNEIMQKILPRVQGSSSSIKDVLSDLFKKLAGDYSKYDASGAAIYKQMEGFLKSETCKYPNSAKKIAFMMRRYEEDGFTSYWL